MLGSFFEWISSLVRDLRPWVVILPWEQGIIVFRGKTRRLVGPGMYFKVPILHAVRIFPIRRRTVSAPLQTLRTQDGRTVTIGIALQYCIKDLLLVMDTLHHPEGTLVHMAQGAISSYVAATESRNITPEGISTAVLTTMDASTLGIADIQVIVTDNADLSSRTIRLLQGNREMYGETTDGLSRPN